MKNSASFRLLRILCLLFLSAGCSKLPAHGVRTEDNLEAGHAVASVAAAEGNVVIESAREIPVAYDVDVVVVGGTSGAVAAAVEAANKGAKVFLAAQRPYLGEDICGTYRLWLEAGEEPTSPLAQKIFAEPPAARRLRSGIPFSYEADKPSAGVHRDTEPASVLCDGKWHSAPSQSVQYDGDVTITADMGGQQAVRNVHLMVYQRDNDFEVESVTVSVSNDRQQWRQVAAIKNDKLGEGGFEQEAIELSAPIADQARYVMLLVKKTAEVKRVLLGEILIESQKQTQELSEGPRVPPTPMQVKRTLDEALLEAGVPFLFGCYTTDVLTNADGNITGIVMANRSGRQAVKAKVVVDATPQASVARMAGADFQPYPAGLQAFKRIVVGDELRGGEGIQARKMPAPVLAGSGRRHTAIEYTLSIPMKDGSFASLTEAEQVARDKTWYPGQLDASEALFQVPPDAMKGRQRLSGSWPGAGTAALDVFRPSGVKRLYVLGGCVDVPRDVAESLLRPVELMELGSRIGAAAASEAAAIAESHDVKVRGQISKPVASGDIREDLGGIGGRESSLGTVTSERRAVPVLGEYDVVVVGGGTGGAPAGIAAARQGAKTVVIEYQHGLGGVGTLGLIASYYYGHREGFTREVDEGVAKMGGGEGPDVSSRTWNVAWKAEWYRRELRKAGADIWFGALGCGAFVEDGRVTGAVVATPQGRGVVLAKAVIDSTGNADVAAAAGAQCVYTDGSTVAVQGAGLPPRRMGAGYTNTDWTFIDDADVIDVWRALVVAKKKYEEAYDLGQFIDTRERRRIVGDFVMSPMDISMGRTYPDTVVIAKSNFDSHGFTIHPLFTLRPPDRAEMTVNVPYRCLLPQGLDGILVTGLGVSAHRDAMPVIRMQADIQNQGYAAGVAAAMSVASGKSVREVDVNSLQKHLVAKGSVPERVLTDEDPFPLPKEEVEQAVKNVVNDYTDLEVILAQPEQALPLLRKAYENYIREPFAGSKFEEEKLIYAHILGMMGDPAGVDTLAEAVQSRDWDEGWKFTGMGQFGPSLSKLDSLIIALGHTHDKKALAPTIEKVEQLGPEHALSHHRAVAVGLETLGDPAGAKPLAELLGKPGMTGHAFTDIRAAKDNTPASPTDNTTREHSLRELFLARALYRCGDHEGLGEKVLKEYARDLRGHYARHATAVLSK